jgi:hypothetical protein
MQEARHIFLAESRVWVSGFGFRVKGFGLWFRVQGLACLRLLQRAPNRLGVFLSCSVLANGVVFCRATVGGDQGCLVRVSKITPGSAFDPGRGPWIMLSPSVRRAAAAACDGGGGDRDASRRGTIVQARPMRIRPKALSARHRQLCGSPRKSRCFCRNADLQTQLWATLHSSPTAWNSPTPWLILIKTLSQRYLRARSTVGLPHWRRP